ncbi:hypothetical protein EYF80_037407 [Liparis tanakae]|uniref:Uncharacterized protein n=1 Tax=Liparis tanakae TaxID=230148 RepID=A0A4Z2GHY6_9TELE|nr:hypothetical protein EYF80_037407 [Liparis tanakae]
MMHTNVDNGANGLTLKAFMGLHSVGHTRSDGNVSQGTKLSHQPSEERAAQPRKNVGSLLYLQRKQSNISALQNDE